VSDASSNISSEGRVWVGGATVRWWSELGPTVFSGIDVDAMTDNDGGIAL
jgi:hypothetical protein